MCRQENAVQFDAVLHELVQQAAIKGVVTHLLVYAAEYNGLLPQDTELAQKTNVPDVFGATQEDTQGLRIVSLEEVTPAASILLLRSCFVKPWIMSCCVMTMVIPFA